MSVLVQHLDYAKKGRECNASSTYVGTVGTRVHAFTTRANLAASFIRLSLQQQDLW